MGTLYTGSGLYRGPPCAHLLTFRVLKSCSQFSRETCCKLLVEHKEEQGEEEEVVDDMEGGVPVDDNVAWSITLLAHPST